MKLLILSFILLCLALETEARPISAACHLETIPSVEAIPKRQGGVRSVCEMHMSYGLVLVRDFENGFQPELVTLNSKEAVASYYRAQSGGGYVVGNPILFEPGESVPAPELVPAFRRFFEKNKTRIEFHAHSLSLLETTSRDLVEAGTHRFDATKAPFRGHWWPMKDAPIANGSSSPLGKFDAFFKEEGSAASSWEREKHSHTEDWAGHCNGWAASSILFSEPTSSVTDPRTGITFSAPDLKALLTESSFCVSYLFYGKRYYTEQDDITDIKPSLFHRVLTHFLRDQKKAVVLDIKPGKEVYNYVASGVSFEIVASAVETLRVRASLRLHSYDSGNSGTGTAPSETSVYEYELRVSNGKIVGDGTWLSQNPDFVWVPLAPKNCGASRENPHLKDSWVEQILNLPRM